MILMLYSLPSVVPSTPSISQFVVGKLLRPLACLSGIAVDGAPPLVVLCAETSGWPIDITVDVSLLFDSCVMTFAIFFIMVIADALVRSEES